MATRDALQQKFGWKRDTCDLQPEGRPPAVAGELYVAVCEDGLDNSAQASLDEMHRLSVTVTRRCPAAPIDRISAEIIHKATLGAEIIADQVKSFLHTNYSVITKANQYLVDAFGGTATIYGFAVPLAFASGTRGVLKTGDWFEGDSDDENAGVVVTLTFARAERLQSLAAET